MAGTVTDQLKRICRKMGGLDVSGTVTDLLAKIESLSGTLPDGALINATANFYRNTKPLTRVDGSALVIGDRWVNPSTGTEGFWNGTYWLSLSPKFIGNGSFVSATINNSYSGAVISSLDFLEKVYVEYKILTGNIDAANHYTLSVKPLRGDGAGLGTLSQINGQLLNSPISAALVFSPNVVLSGFAEIIIGLQGVYTRVGTAGGINVSIVGKYREVL